MSKCVSPLPDPPPPEIRTDLTCATLDLGSPPVDEPSNCVCPDTILDYPIGNYEFYYDRFWNVGVFVGDRYQRQYLISLLVNKDGKSYSQIFSHAKDECETYRQNRMEVQVLNQPGLRKIACLDYAANGTILQTHYDVDMSAVFGDGLEHRVTIVFYQTTGTTVGTRVLVDDQLIGDSTRNWNEVSDFVRFQVIGNVADAFVPFAMWQYQVSIEQCISSGIFNGFGGCELLKQDAALRWDVNLSDLGLDFFNAERVVAAGAGANENRIAYLNHPKMSGRVYWEVNMGRAALCRADGNYAFGCVERGQEIDVMPGLAPNSWGLTDNQNRLFADGVLVASDVTVAIHQCFCYDVQKRELWIGWDQGPAGWGQRVWHGGGEPGAGATSWVLFPIVLDMRIVFRFFEETNGAIFVLSSAKSCRFPAPSGFEYLT